MLRNKLVVGSAIKTALMALLFSDSRIAGEVHEDMRLVVLDSPPDASRAPEVEALQGEVMVLVSFEPANNEPQLSEFGFPVEKMNFRFSIDDFLDKPASLPSRQAEWPPFPRRISDPHRRNSFLAQSIAHNHDRRFNRFAHRGYK